MLVAISNRQHKALKASFIIDVFSNCCVAIQCPVSATKTDLIAYLERISLYCHQLNITSKVKADVQNISGELIVSGVSVSISIISASNQFSHLVPAKILLEYY